MFKYIKSILLALCPLAIWNWASNLETHCLDLFGMFSSAWNTSCSLVKAVAHWRAFRDAGVWLFAWHCTLGGSWRLDSHLFAGFIRFCINCIKMIQDVSSLVAIECCKLLQKLRIAQLCLALGTSVDEQTHCNPTEPGGTLWGFLHVWLAEWCESMRCTTCTTLLQIDGGTKAVAARDGAESKRSTNSCMMAEAILSLQHQNGCCCKDYDWLFWVDCDLFFMNPATGAKSKTSSQVPKFPSIWFCEWWSNRAEQPLETTPDMSNQQNTSSSKSLHPAGETSE